MNYLQNHFDGIAIPQKKKSVQLFVYISEWVIFPFPGFVSLHNRWLIFTNEVFRQNFYVFERPN